VLAAVLGRMVQKDKPLTYLETHAGRGLYDLGAPEALKTGEAAAGIGRLAPALPAAHPLAQVIGAVRAAHGARAYPGSPLIAAHLLRPGDRMHLAELHPQEHAALLATMAPFGADVRREDGFAMARALCPPMPRRGILLIDPPYEVKEDYARIPPFTAAIHRKWNVGILILWYPILASGAHLPMRAALEAAGMAGAVGHELRFGPARPGHKMLGSGLFVVNAPHGLDAALAEVETLMAPLLDEETAP
jgi:23S rRNA (adenine2030-N6)-methyltransferase